jgi:hypothetical protein
VASDPRLEAAPVPYVLVRPRARNALTVAVVTLALDQVVSRRAITISPRFKK